MEIQIQDLISSIKSDGIEKAKEQQNEILKKANEEALSIIENAKAESAKILSQAKRDIEIERKSSEEKLRQAARDALLSIKKEIEDEVKKILRDDIKRAMDKELLSSLIQTAVKATVGDEEVVISESDKEKVTHSLITELSESLERGLTLSYDKALSGGFTLKAKDGSGYFDLSDEEIAKLLYPYLSENLKSLL